MVDLLDSSTGVKCSTSCFLGLAEVPRFDLVGSDRVSVFGIVYLFSNNSSHALHSTRDQEGKCAQIISQKSS